MKRLLFLLIFILSVSSAAFAADPVITDECANWDNVFEHSEYWTVKENAFGDTYVFGRQRAAMTTSAPQYITYYNENFKSIKILYWYNSTAAKNGITLFVSDDNLNWSEITPEKTECTNGSFTGMWLYTDMTGKKYIKLQIPKNVGFTACGIGEVQLEILGECDNYVDDLSIGESFKDAGHPQRESLGAKVVNQSSSFTAQTGDSNVVAGYDNAVKDAEIVFRTEQNKEMIITAYLCEGDLSENTFKIEYSADRISWTEGSFTSNDAPNAKNATGESYYKSVIKSKTPPGAKYMKLTWINSFWNKLVGEVEMRDVKTAQYDDFSDLKNMIGKSFYVTNTTENNKNVMRRKKYFSAENEFSKDSEIVNKYGEYNEKQYIEYAVDESVGRNLIAHILYNESKYSTYLFKFYYRTETGGEKYPLEAAWQTDTSIGEYGVSACAEGIPANAVSVVIEWPDVNNEFIYLSGIEFYDNDKAVEITKLKYYSDRTKITQTPEAYGGKTTVTGVISNPYYGKTLNIRMIAALYDSDGRMISAKSKLLPGGVSPRSKKTFSMEVDDKYGIAKKLGVFLWNGMTPVCSKLTDVTYKPEEFPEISGEFTDDFSDFSKMYSYPQAMRIEKREDITDEEALEKDVGAFGDALHRLMRMWRLPQSIKYNVENAKSVRVEAFLLDKEGNIEIYASSFDADYIKLNVSQDGPTVSNRSWYKVVYSADNLPENTDFIKIVIDSDDGGAWTPALSKVTISY